MFNCFLCSVLFYNPLSGATSGSLMMSTLSAGHNMNICWCFRLNKKISEIKSIRYKGKEREKKQLVKIVKLNFLSLVDNMK